MSSIQVKVALEKERHPERFCPAWRCLWKTGGSRCPRHPARNPITDYPKSRENRETRFPKTSP